MATGAHRPARARLELEVLEDRRLPASHMTFNGLTGVVTVHGTPRNDTVFVSYRDDWVRVGLHGGAREVRQFARPLVTRVRLRSHGGHDRLFNFTIVPTQTAVAPAPVPSAGPDPAPAGPGKIDAAAAGALLIQQTNALRLAYGLEPLAISALLQTIAQAHADALASRDRYGDDNHNGGILDGHDYEYRAAAAGYRWLALGETTGFNYGYDDPALMLVQEWLGSPAHLGHVLSAAYTETGYGFARGVSGRTYGVVMFGSPAP